MASTPMQYVLILAAVLFSLGLIGLLVRRNIFFTLLSIEIMLNAAGLAFVAAGSRLGAGRWASDVRVHSDDDCCRSERWTGPADAAISALQNAGY